MIKKSFSLFLRGIQWLAVLVLFRSLGSLYANQGMVLLFGFSIFLFLLAGLIRAIFFRNIRLIFQPHKADTSTTKEYRLLAKIRPYWAFPDDGTNPTVIAFTLRIALMLGVLYLYFFVFWDEIGGHWILRYVLALWLVAWPTFSIGITIYTWNRQSELSNVTPDVGHDLDETDPNQTTTAEESGSTWWKWLRYGFWIFLVAWIVFNVVTTQPVLVMVDGVRVESCEPYLPEGKRKGVLRTMRKISCEINKKAE